MATPAGHPRHDSPSKAVDAFTAAGYADVLMCHGSKLRGAHTGEVYDPESVIIDSEERFEGSTDPAAQQLVMAIRHVDQGPLGTLVVPFGPAADAEQAEVLGRLARADRAARSEGIGGSDDRS